LWRRYNKAPHFAFNGSSPESQLILKRAKAEGHWVGNHSPTHMVESGAAIDKDAPKIHIGKSQERLGEVVAYNKFFAPKSEDVQAP